VLSTARHRPPPIGTFILNPEELLNKKWLDFATREKNIWKTVSTKSILSALGSDRVGYHLLKHGKSGVMTLLKSLFEKIAKAEQIQRFRRVYLRKAAKQSRSSGQDIITSQESARESSCKL
jgi:hypothetical protein